MELATLTTIDGMDSREIASMTGKDHGHVCRDIRTMLEEMNEGGESKFGSSYISEQNKKIACYLLPKRECLILASGYSVMLRAAIIDRWAELESSKPVMTIIDYAKALIASDEEKQLLLVELDRSKEFASIKRMEKAHRRKFDWRKLKAQGAEMGVQSKEVFDQNYGTVKSYRADVWMETYQVIVPKDAA